MSFELFIFVCFLNKILEVALKIRVEMTQGQEKKKNGWMAFNFCFSIEIAYLESE